MAVAWWCARPTSSATSNARCASVSAEAEVPGRRLGPRLLAERVDHPDHRSRLLGHGGLQTPCPVVVRSRPQRHRPADARQSPQGRRGEDVEQRALGLLVAPVEQVDRRARCGLGRIGREVVEDPARPHGRGDGPLIVVDTARRSRTDRGAPGRRATSHTWCEGRPWSARRPRPPAARSWAPHPAIAARSRPRPGEVPAAFPSGQGDHRRPSPGPDQVLGGDVHLVVLEVPRRGSFQELLLLGGRGRLAARSGAGPGRAGGSGTTGGGRRGAG